MSMLLALIWKVSLIKKLLILIKSRLWLQKALAHLAILLYHQDCKGNVPHKSQIF